MEPTLTIVIYLFVLKDIFKTCFSFSNRFTQGIRLGFFLPPEVPIVVEQVMRRI